jgi:hypothetical protein
MRLSLQADYALRTLLFLATRTERTTVSVVAEFFAISAHHVGKEVHQLGRLGYVKNHRGLSAVSSWLDRRAQSRLAVSSWNSRATCTCWTAWVYPVGA